MSVLWQLSQVLSCLRKAVNVSNFFVQILLVLLLLAPLQLSLTPLSRSVLKGRKGVNISAFWHFLAFTQSLNVAVDTSKHAFMCTHVYTHTHLQRCCQLVKLSRIYLSFTHDLDVNYHPLCSLYLPTIPPSKICMIFIHTYFVAFLTTIPSLF